MFSHSATDAQENLDHSKLDLNIRDSKKMLENCVKYLKGFSGGESTLHEINTKSNESFCTVSGGDIFKELQLSASNEDIFFGQYLSKLRRKNIGHVILTHININQLLQL